MKRPEDVINQLRRIAKENKDEFEIMRHVHAHERMMYEFICRESKEKHVFVSGLGTTLEEAVLDAGNDIAAACNQWGYKYVD